jgi:hypothetical protein
VDSTSTLEIRHRLAGPVIALGERVRGLGAPVVRIRWPRSRRHATIHAILLGVFSWIIAATVYFAGPGDRTIVGPLKGADFVHFYTLGHLAASGRIDTIYDMKALHDAQVALVPASAPELYPTVYPPQAALLFVPFSYWSYRQALAIWTALTMTLYAVILWTTWRRIGGRPADRILVFAAAAAFPPVFTLVLYGQISMVIVLAFWLGWLALERGRSYLAGAAFGLLALKPQFGLPLAAIVLACGEWRMLAGAVSSVVAQAAAVWLTLGAAAFTGFASSIPITVTSADWLVSEPHTSHSLRSVTRLLPKLGRSPAVDRTRGAGALVHSEVLAQPGAAACAARHRDSGFAARQPARHRL